MTLQRRRPQARPYQLEAVRQVHEQWAEGRIRVLIVAPTGSGKTVTAGFLVADEVEAGGRVLALTDRKKLTRQFAHRTEQDFGIPCGIEMASEGHEQERVVSATVQTITTRIKQGQFHPEDFSMIFMDEAHLALGAGWQAAASHFANAKVVGLTATPVASQQRDLLTFFDAKVETATLKDLIEQQYLAPIKVKNFPIHIRLEASSKNADFKDEDISHAIDPYLESCADALVEIGAKRCCMAFLPLIKTSQKFAAMLNERGFTTEHVDGEMDERAVNEALKRLEMGITKCLTCSMILAVGVDIKPVNLILSLRPTKSWTLFCLDEKTEILTERGWIGRHQISEKDRCAAFDMETGETAFLDVREVVDRPLMPGEKMVSYAGRSLDFRVTGQHDLVVKTKRPTSKWRKRWALDVEKLNNHVFVPVCGDEILPSKANLSDDELRFLGWFVSDGSRNKKTNGVTITQSIESPYVLEIKRVLDAIGVKYSEYIIHRKDKFSDYPPTIRFHVSKGTPRGRDKHLRGWGHLEAWIDKSIPSIYNLLSRAQLLIFLDALFQGDGFKQETRDWEMHTRSITMGGNKQAADRLQALCVMRGIRCNITKQAVPNKWNPRPADEYLIRYNPDQRQATIKGRKADGNAAHPIVEHDTSPAEWVWCVRNDWGTLITRRNGKVMVMGNCQQIGRGTRTFDPDKDGPKGTLWPKKDDLLVCDPLWLTDSHNLLQRPATLFAKNEEEAKVMDEKLKEGGGDLLQAFGDMMHEREEALKKRLEAMSRRASRTIDAMSLFSAIGRIDLAEYEPMAKWEREVVTDGQRDFLLKNKIDLSTVKDRGHASKICDALIQRVKSGMGTIAQAHYATSLGHPDAYNRSFQELGLFITDKKAGRDPFAEIPDL